jgi:hypothetical protein
MPYSNPYTRTLNFRCTVEEWQAFQLEAAEKKVPMNKLLRDKVGLPPMVEPPKNYPTTNRGHYEKKPDAVKLIGDNDGKSANNT